MDVMSLARAVSLRVYILLIAVFVFSAIPAVFAQSASDPSQMIWTEQTNTPYGGVWVWQGIASSADGRKLFALTDSPYAYTGEIFASSDAGASWGVLGSAPFYQWQAITSSADGNNLAVCATNGEVYTSSDGGTTWVEKSNSGFRRWWSLASSADGRTLIANDESNRIMTSSDAGDTWVEHFVGPGSNRWYSVASSADGSIFIVASQVGNGAGTIGGEIFTSSDAGVTWTDQTSAGARHWSSVASSADGTKLVATVHGGNIYTSSDSGATWTEHVIGTDWHYWSSVASSADGTKLAAADELAGTGDGTLSTGEIYTSSDSGATWVPQTSAGSRGWTGIVSSADGTKLAATDGGGRVWTAVNSIPVASIKVTTSSLGATVASGQTMPMIATVLPANATNPSVTWSVENETGTATISPLGVLTAGNTGTVIVKATANDGSGIVGTEEITILNACALTNTCVSNVMFLPGIEGSKLYNEDGKAEVWLPADDNSADVLRMVSTGSSTNQAITATGAIDKATVFGTTHNVYQSFLDEMKDWEKAYGIIATTTPYDWRLDFNSVVSNGRKLPNGHISYLQAPEAGHDPYLIETLKQLAATSQTKKVTIVAHSMGGLIAKQLMLKLGDAETAKYIDKVILVATPQVGTPAAAAALLNGHDAGIPWVTSNEKGRDIAQNMPSSYDLLPSLPYFTYVDDPVITIATTTLSTWVNAYGSDIHWAQGLYNFMADIAHTRTTPEYSNLNDPEIVNKTLLNQAQTTHASLDTWTPPAGVQLFTIAGWGNETLASIKYQRFPTPVCVDNGNGGTCAYYTNGFGPVSPSFSNIIDGDGVVVVPSAQWANGADSTRYWVNLDDYNRVMGMPKISSFRTDHTFIFEISELRTLLQNVLQSGSKAAIPNKYISTTQPSYTGKVGRLHFTLHSPLTLGFKDADGNYTGATATTPLFAVPDVDYERYGEVQWLSIPTDLAGQVVMHGTGTGSFALQVEEQHGDTVTGKTTFAAIPSSNSTIATMTVNPSQSMTASSKLLVDYNGDGTVDATYAAKQFGMVLPDNTAPTTTATTTGTLGAKGWYTSDVKVVLSAIDSESGLATTTFSLNGGGALLSTTTTPVNFTITKEGTTTIAYFSIDTAGNREATSTLLVKIDKTPPEVQLGFSTTTKKIFAIGTDVLSSITVKSSATSTSISDLAGNTLTLKISQNASLSNSASLVIPSFKYSTGTSTIATTSLRYFWLTDKSNKFTLLISAIRTPTDRLVSLYVPIVNKTYILQSLPTDDTDDLSKMTIQLLLRKVVKQVSGMAVPNITTKQGLPLIGY